MSEEKNNMYTTLGPLIQVLRCFLYLPYHPSMVCRWGRFTAILISNFAFVSYRSFQINIIEFIWSGLHIVICCLHILRCCFFFWKINCVNFCPNKSAIVFEKKSNYHSIQNQIRFYYNRWFVHFINVSQIIDILKITCGKLFGASLF